MQPPQPPPPAPRPSAAAVFAACDLVPLGDGSYKAIPRKPRQKVSVKEAARIANYPLASIYRLYDAGFIQGERQSPRKIMIHVETLHAHLEAVRDPEFWTRARRELYAGKPAKFAKQLSAFPGAPGGLDNPGLDGQSFPT